MYMILLLYSHFSLSIQMIDWSSLAVLNTSLIELKGITAPYHIAPLLITVGDVTCVDCAEQKPLLTCYFFLRSVTGIVPTFPMVN